MGLDMYLDKIVYIGGEYEHNEVKGSLEVESVWLNGKLVIPAKELSSVSIRVGYWRKANAIHKWFVDNIQEGVDNCAYYFVSLESLKQLLDLCRKVLLNKEKAAELLPTKEGFFFGGYEYDEWYFLDIKETIGIIEPLVKNGADEEFMYHSSW
jgi:hypothetical protein